MGRVKSGGLLKGIIFLLLAFALLYLFLESSWVQRKIYPLHYADEIFKYSGKYQVDPHLVMSIIWVESKFDPMATSSKDARGLMQIIPRTGRWVAQEIGLKQYDDNKLYDPDVNVQLGCWYVSYLSQEFSNNRVLILAAYNGGMGNVRKWLKNKKYSRDGINLHFIPFRETREYVAKVLKVYNKYRELYNT